MPDIFVSYTSSDKDWAFWIGQQLEKLGHTVHIHEWEISAGENIAAWMEKRLDDADFVMCVISRAYLSKDYSNWERQSGQWEAVSNRRNFVLPVFIEDCEAPRLLALLKRCDLYGMGEEDARAKLAEYLKPAGKPEGPMHFPGEVSVSEMPLTRPEKVRFPGPSRSQILTAHTKPTLTTQTDSGQMVPPTRPLTEFDITSMQAAWSILEQATAQVPAVRYAMGLAGIAAAAAIVTTLTNGYSGITTLAVGLLIVAMIVLYLFSYLVQSKSKSVHYAGMTLMWAVVLVVIIFMGFTATAVAFSWPCNWAMIMKFRLSCGTPIGPESVTSGPPPSIFQETVGYLEPGNSRSPLNACDGILPPDELRILFGDNAAGMFRINQVNLVQVGTCKVLWIDRTDKGIAVNADLYNAEGNLMARVRDNQLHSTTGGSTGLRRRGDLNTFIIDDANGNEYLYVRLLNKTVARARGIFGCPGHALVPVRDGESIPGLTLSNVCLINAYSAFFVP